jgi:hypothetical protein
MLEEREKKTMETSAQPLSLTRFKVPENTNVKHY